MKNSNNNKQLFKVSDLESRFNREFENGRIVYTICEGCGSEKGQWADETNDQNGYELNVILCTSCAKSYMEYEEYRMTLH